MKSRIFLQVILTSCIMIPAMLFAATGDTSTGTTTESSTATGFLLSGITVEDDAHILMEFSENVVIESIRIRIAKQTDGTNIKVDSLTGVIDNPKSVSVSLVDLLESGEAYTITVISALSEKGVTITEGTDALSEFIAPDPLKQSMVVFNAPPNPSATEAEIVPQEEEVQTITETAATTTEDAIEEPTPKTDELPLTGMNPIYFIILSAVIALWIVTRKRAS